MKKFKHLHRLAYLLLAAGMLFINGCVDKPEYGVKPDDKTPEKGNTFNYATRSDVKVNIDYGLKGNKALFKIYEEEPVTIGEDGSLQKKEGAKAQLTAWTNGDSQYSGLIDLSTAVDKVYLYTENYGLPTCVEVEVTADGISFDYEEYLAKKKEEYQNGLTKAAGRSPLVTRASASNPYNIQTIGAWDEVGYPDYLIGTWEGKRFYPTQAEIPEGLYNRIETVLLPGTSNSHYARPTKNVNINVTKDARLKLVFLAELAAWYNGIGYYYYDAQNPPKTQSEFDQLPKYVAFPNCSQFSGTDSFWPPLEGGFQINLVYFDAAGKRSDIFPAGTTVGWFMLCDAFSFKWQGYDQVGELSYTPARGIRYSNNEFNQNELKTCISLYDAQSAKTVLGFEDGGDNDYKDVLFYVDADPVDAIYDPDRPVIGPDKPNDPEPDVTGDAIEGTLAFEDLWPDQGDYDMNDVVIKYSTTFTIDKDNRIIRIQDVFTPKHVGGQLNSAFGYQLNISPNDVAKVTIENGSSTATVNEKNLERGQSKATLMLFDDVRQAISRGPITVTLELDGNYVLNNITRKSLYNPFICVNQSGFVPDALRKEVHLTNYAPTDLADQSLFGQGDDKTPIQDGQAMGPYYYLTSDNHPFAIDLNITDYRVPDEKVKIDKFYPDFTEWATSNGEKNKDWYLYPAH